MNPNVNMVKATWRLLGDLVSDVYFVVAAVLIVFGVVQIILHLRAWRKARQTDMDPKERDYRWRQCRRRTQSSAMLAVLGVAILGGRWMAGPPWVFLGYWAVVLLLVLWMMLLALADIIATKHYYARVRQHYMLEEVKLQAELRRLQGAQRNGHSNGKSKRHGPKAGGSRPDASSEQDHG